MRIQLTEEKTFTARAGEQVFTGLRLESEWQGFRKLINDAGAALIVDGDNNLLRVAPPLSALDRLITVPATKLPDGSVVPEFRVGQFTTGKGADGKLRIDRTAKPWVDINYRDARKASTAAGYELITERQWLALAWNVAGVDANWTEGKVGQGKLFQGIRLGNVSEAQPGAYQPTDADERRWLRLSNDETICDFNGNAWQWVFDDIQGDADGLIKGRIAADSLSLQAPYGPNEKGIGWRPSSSVDWSGVALLRGGYWRSGSSAGVFDLGGGWPGLALDLVGFRCTERL